MDWNELIERLNGYEWNDVDFKEALEQLPHKLPMRRYRPLPIQRAVGSFLVSRKTMVTLRSSGFRRSVKVETEFLSTLHQAKRMNYLPAVTGGKMLRRHTHGSYLLHPKAPREAKPVYPQR